MSDPPADPRDAATVILLRPLLGADESFELFMVRRHDKSGFMAGAYVFPGGILDDADLDPMIAARAIGRTPSEAAASLGEADHDRAIGLYVAAIRETFEEAGILLADGADDRDDREGARARLNDGTAFSAIAVELDVMLRLDELAPWSRWVTPVIEQRRYDARFFVARTHGAQHAGHDRVEVTAGEWMQPTRALERYYAGEISLPPPTLRTLEQLAVEASIDAVFERAAGRVPEIVQPELVSANGAIALTLPGDPAHSVRERRIDGPSRFVLRDGRFHSTDS